MRQPNQTPKRRQLLTFLSGAVDELFSGGGRGGVGRGGHVGSRTTQTPPIHMLARQGGPRRSCSPPQGWLVSTYHGYKGGAAGLQRLAASLALRRRRGGRP